MTATERFDVEALPSLEIISRAEGFETGATFSADPTRPILHICTRFAKGGSEQRLCDMVAALPAHRHVVILGADSDLDEAQRRLPRAELLVEPKLLRSISPVADSLAVVGLRRSIRSIDPAVVVTHQSKAGAVGRLAARTAGSPPVVHSLSMADFGPGYGVVEGAMLKNVERSLAAWTAAYAVVGSDLADRFKRVGVPAEKMAIVRSGLRLPPELSSGERRIVRQQLAAAHDLSADRPWMLYVGSLDERKSVLDLPILLQQTRQLLLGEEHPFLIIAGAGPDESGLRDRFQQIGLDNDYRMLGHVADPTDLFVAADAVVLLSRAEGLPQVLVQAAAAGTPFVSTDVDGANELLELGATGAVVDSGDVIGAARAVLPYLRWPADRRGQAIELASWSASSVRDGYQDLFESVLDPATRAGATPDHAGLGCVVALLGSDGSGKSTLSRALTDAFAADHEVMHLYMGSGDGPSSLLRWPLKRAKRALLGPGAGAVRRDAFEARAPRALGFSKAVWALVLAREKTAKLRQARRAADRGVLVLCDRYPQGQTPGSTDGPLLSEWASSNSRWRRALAARELRPYALADSQQPDLVIRLNVEQETAIHRRPEHDPDALRERRRIVQELRFDKAACGVIEIDANRPFDSVFTEVQAHISKVLETASPEAT